MAIGGCALFWMGPVAAAPPFCATDQVADRAFCSIKRTGSGFVDLRAGPSDAARTIARMAADDEVMIRRSQQGRWLEVTWWRGQSRRLKGFDSHAGKGWVWRASVGQDCD